ncbi:MAG TPA: hypothetical protein VNT60_09450 [Deinococcales bacterium]|nr:hypothetical protein [Deinococcales bacterium]
MSKKIFVLVGLAFFLTAAIAQKVAYFPFISGSVDVPGPQRPLEVIYDGTKSTLEPFDLNNKLSLTWLKTDEAKAKRHGSGTVLLSPREAGTWTGVLPSKGVLLVHLHETGRFTQILRHLDDEQGPLKVYVTAFEEKLVVTFNCKPATFDDQSRCWLQ